MQKKKDPYKVEAINRVGIRENNYISEEIVPSTLILGEYLEEIYLDPVEIKTHDIVLGYPWLETHNPSIN